MSASEFPHGVRPRIGEGESAIEPITMRAEYELPWNRQSSQTACGAVIQNQVGDLGWRVVIEGKLTMIQLRKLAQMREQDQITVVTEEFGEMQVAFDNLIITRTDEEEAARVQQTEGQNYKGPIVDFQLQTKEDSGDDGEGIQFFNENTRGAVYEGE